MTGLYLIVLIVLSVPGYVVIDMTLEWTFRRLEARRSRRARQRQTMLRALDRLEQSR